MEFKRLLLEDKGFCLYVSLDELHRNQHNPHPEVAYSYPDVRWLAVGVHEHPLGNTELLSYRIVDRVASAVVGCRCPRPAHAGLFVYCCVGHL